MLLDTHSKNETVGLVSYNLYSMRCGLTKNKQGGTLITILIW